MKLSVRNAQLIADMSIDTDDIPANLLMNYKTDTKKLIFFWSVLTFFFSFSIHFHFLWACVFLGFSMLTLLLTKHIPHRAAAIFHGPLSRNNGEQVPKTGIGYEYKMRCACFLFLYFSGNSGWPLKFLCFRNNWRRSVSAGLDAAPWIRQSRWTRGGPIIRPVVVEDFFSHQTWWMLTVAK